MRRLPVAVLFNSYPLLLDVLEPTLRGRIEIAGRATTTSEAARLIDLHEPDLLVAGVEAAGDPEDVFRLVREAREKHGLKVIAFSSSADSRLLADAFDAGVSALIAPNGSPDDIAVAIRQTTDPSIHFAPTRLPAPEPRSAIENGVPLTDREIETVRLVAKGLSNAEVGRTLLVTEQTVKFHLSNIFRKLNVSNRTQATRRAEMMNLLDESPDVQAQALAP
jgi:DNA-binding NarL/FixJ family response regulator